MEKMESEEDSAMRRRLAQILRYVSSMHQSLSVNDDTRGHSFVREVGSARGDRIMDFFQGDNEADDALVDERHCGVLFSTHNFRELISMESKDASTSQSPLFEKPPFSFYAASSSTNQKNGLSKRTLKGALKTAFGSNASANEKGYWLRITRLTATQVLSRPLPSHPAVNRYLEDWMAKSPRAAAAASIEHFVTLERLERAPKVPPTASVREGHQIMSFLRQYKRFLRKKVYQETLEPMYNHLFEWIQHQQDHVDELVFGLGHARMLTEDGSLINGPLLEIKVEVEMGRDGALLIRPREHTGVALNRQVVSALTRGEASGLSQLHRDVAELEPLAMSPGQPSTYVSLLRRIAVELSPGGSFHPSSAKSNNATADQSRLVVSEAWCLYSRPKPSSVWARDATAFADQLMLSTTPGNQNNHLVVPKAAWSITHGPGVLERILANESNRKVNGGLVGWLQKAFLLGQTAERPDPLISTRPMFPLPTSDAQSRIAELLMNKQTPAVVCEGPPGTGKTHSIANIICAYLCRGKRVLVTSKNSPALAVLRDRLPESVRDLCVDVSMSELAGMRQLQKTVERLANRVACANPEMESRKCDLLQRNIDELEAQLRDIDEGINDQSGSICDLLRQPEGERMVEISLSLIKTAPWLMKSVSSWEDKDVISLQQNVSDLVLHDNDPILDASGFDRPPSAALVSHCGAMAGSALSKVSVFARQTVAAMPVLGAVSGMDAQTASVLEDSRNLKIKGNDPVAACEWDTLAKALRHAQALHSFEHNVWRPHQRREGWPVVEISNREKLCELNALLDLAVEFKQLVSKLEAKKEVALAAECRALDSSRNKICSQIKRLAEELVDAAVVKELSQSFSPEAQSALIQFSQIAGKARFSRSAQASKMTQRQRRRRQEYLSAFDRCSRFIPCWVLTTSQISDYLPSECLFDLVIIDEASQSDITVLPGMLRGRQWLIVGDGKQVSPTECFVSEEQIDSLRHALPSSPLENSLLPGQSFFDMCSQAFPRGRVVLREHFRCAESIIAFSNEQFYDSRLVPLRLPTKSERLVPSIIDVHVRNGVKSGKVNQQECDKIVEMVQATISDPDVSLGSRSIGVISLIGDEQSRIIRGRLLDAIGPEQMARHNILVGDPPTFQGAERDIIFISMVCSKGSVPTQNQLMHYQRANVAMSRARDRCVLVRSIEFTDVPNADDIKRSIIEFFQTASNLDENRDQVPPGDDIPRGRRKEGVEILTSLLLQRGFAVRSMGEVWANAVCVEQPESDVRAAVLVDCEGESRLEWRSSFLQQKAIERVGWKCLRLDALSLFVDFNCALRTVIKFLSDVGIKETALIEPGEDGIDEDFDDNEPADEEVDDHGGLQAQGDDDEVAGTDEEVVVISSDSAASSRAKPDTTTCSASSNFGSYDEFDAAQFGEVVDLDFLRENYRDDSQAEEAGFAQLDDDSSSAYQGDQSDTEDNANNPRQKRRRRYRRLDKYSRDGHWHPSQQKDCYDTDSDLKEAARPGSLDKPDPRGTDEHSLDEGEL